MRIISIGLVVSVAAVDASRWRVPFFSQKQYTPLVFFTVPPGLVPECDAMEAVVRNVEKELNIRVERLDIMREPAAEAVLALLTDQLPPFLYHRESCTSVHVPSKTNPAATKSDMPVGIDVDRVRAWAKGRFLAPVGAVTSGVKVSTPVVVSQNEQYDEDQDDLLEDLTLTPRQKEGRDAIRQRTAKLVDEGDPQ
jgi:hypothetical protein